MLIPPQNPRIRQLDMTARHVVNHDDFNDDKQDSFNQTSMHLEFTGYESTMTLGGHGMQGAEVFLLETVISVHYGGLWVADVDVLKAVGTSSRPGLADGVSTHLVRQPRPTCAHD